MNNSMPVPRKKKSPEYETAQVIILVIWLYPMQNSMPRTND